MSGARHADSGAQQFILGSLVTVTRVGIGRRAEGGSGASVGSGKVREGDKAIER